LKHYYITSLSRGLISNLKLNFFFIFYAFLVYFYLFMLDISFRIKVIYFQDIVECTESNRTELNMASRDPNFFNISMFFRVRTLFYCIWMILHDVFDAFEWLLLVRFDRTELEKKIEILKKFDSVRFSSIQFDSVRYSRKVLEFHCIMIVKRIELSTISVTESILFRT